MAKRVLVTAALPYANGAIHLGHMLEYIQTDVYARARRLAGDDVIFMWADDAHGTPIQVRARKEGITPEALVERAYNEHRQDFDAFGISYDIFHTTHSSESQAHCEAIYKELKAKELIEVRSIEQLYCPHDQMFLPDRFVKGVCPKCGATDQYGDVCEVCSSTYDPTDLLEAACAICQTKPELRSSDHVFVPLARHEEFLRRWSQKDAVLQPSVRNFIKSWIDQGLRDWDISRDDPYFGFKIPGYDNKYFYVWFDAPIGYVGATQKWCNEQGKDFDAYWKSSPQDTEIVHVIGKDIVYFHCLFWPAMLHNAGYTTPSRVQVHGYLNIDGQKMSKSRGTFVLAKTYLEHLAPDYLRYYFATKLNAGQDDFDLNLEDFTNRVNADLVNKLANLASRCAKFLYSKLDKRIGALEPRGEEILATAQKNFGEAIGHYREFESQKAIRIALEMAEACNLYLTESEPWKLVKSDPERARAICSAGIQISILIAAILKPVLPAWAQRCEEMFKLGTALRLDQCPAPLEPGHEIDEYQHLAQRLDRKVLDAMIEAGKSQAMPETPQAEAPVADYEVEELSEECSIDEVMRVDLRVGQIIGAQKVEGSSKLLEFRVDLGPLGQRTIFSGIAKSYTPEDLMGHKVVVAANLKPRKMRFGVSEGMIMASGEDPKELVVATLDEAARPGDRIS